MRCCVQRWLCCVACSRWLSDNVVRLNVRGGVSTEKCPRCPAHNNQVVINFDKFQPATRAFSYYWMHACIIFQITSFLPTLPCNYIKRMKIYACTSWRLIQFWWQVSFRCLLCLEIPALNFLLHYSLPTGGHFKSESQQFLVCLILYCMQ